MMAALVMPPLSSSSKVTDRTVSNLSKYAINVSGIVNGFKSDTRIVLDLSLLFRLLLLLLLLVFPTEQHRWLNHGLLLLLSATYCCNSSEERARQVECTE